jgi:hypothetical protein
MDLDPGLPLLEDVASSAEDGNAEGAGVDALDLSIIVSDMESRSSSLWGAAVSDGLITYWTASKLSPEKIRGRLRCKRREQEKSLKRVKAR